MKDTEKPVAFEFIGGSRDGTRVIARFGQPLCDYDVSEVTDVSVWYFSCEHGRVGATLTLLTEAATDLILAKTEEYMKAEGLRTTSEIYKVVDRLEGSDQIVVRLRYMN